MFDIIDSDGDFDDEDFSEFNNNGSLSFGNQYKPTDNKKIKLGFNVSLNSLSSQNSPTYSPPVSQIQNSQINMFFNVPQTSTQRTDCSSNDVLLDCSNNLSPIKIQPGISSIVKRAHTMNENESALSHRKFPGPAGYLPQIDNNKDLNSIDISTINTFVNHKMEKNKKETINNQHKQFNSNTQLSDSNSWKIAKLKIGNDCWKYFEYYNVKNILSICINKTEKLPKSKVPIICLKVSDIDYLPRDASAILCDDTGSIKCAIHRHVLHRYKDRIKIGAVFIMKNVSLFSPSGKRYYLNITDRNIIEIIEGTETFDVSINNNSLITESQIQLLINRQNQKMKQETQPQYNTNILNDSNILQPELTNQSIQQPCNTDSYKSPPNVSQITPRQPQSVISHGKSDNSVIINSIFDNFEDDEETNNMLSSFTEEDFDI